MYLSLILSQQLCACCAKPATVCTTSKHRVDGGNADAVPFYHRAVEDAVIPLHEPIRGKDGNIIRELVIPKGTNIVSNLRACNTNKAIWGEDALEWKPERWLQPLPQSVEDARIPGIYSNL